MGVVDGNEIGRAFRPIVRSAVGYNVATRIGLNIGRSDAFVDGTKLGMDFGVWSAACNLEGSDLEI